MLSTSRRSFLLVAAALFLMLMASNLATPLYAVYRHRFGFSAVELTLIFAIYAVVLMPSLLIFGQLSDQLGRRRVMAAGLLGGVISLVLFALARSTAWLFAARGAQGLATGLMTGAAAAALVELEPEGHHGRAAVAIVIGTTGGSGAGPLVAGILAEWAPDPLVLCYLVGIGCLAIALVGVLWADDPISRTGAWRPQRPSVPAPVRGRFARDALSGATVWSVGALFLSVVPSYAANLLHTSNLALLGAIAALMLAVATVAQVGLLRVDLEARRAQTLGLSSLVVGVGLLVAAFPLHSLAAVLGAAGMAGLGLGCALFGAQKDVNQLAPGARRGEVTAAFITCLYGGVAISTITTGVLANHHGLFTAVTIIGGVLAAVAAATIGWHLLAPSASTDAARGVT